MPVTYPDNQENAVRSALNSGTTNSLSAEKQCSPNPLISCMSLLTIASKKLLFEVR
jgi:hypothetical protein